MTTQPPRDNEAYRFPVSVKGIVVRDDAVVLVHNRRDEWELPGGKLEVGETPERCVAREIEEELQLDVETAALVDAWVYSIAADTRVLVLTYGCTERAARAVAYPPAALQLVGPMDGIADGLAQAFQQSQRLGRAQQLIRNRRGFG